MCLWNFSEDGSSGEVGYELMPDFWGNGIVSAGLALVIDYARELLGLSILKACIKPENEPSLRLVKQFGFEKRRQAKCGDVYEMALTQ